ncbi:hypothetical protein LCGC14_0223120 [marine sediment metagenome]|uniref:Uncharacterized protein n=1 Tax=marine sediment metagenome TaxID=412755 RepID=A0A0F9UGC0_9ZZZZ
MPKHNCDEMKYKDKIIICTTPITHTIWCIYLGNYGITIYYIKFCPYCGVKLDVK